MYPYTYAEDCYKRGGLLVEGHFLCCEKLALIYMRDRDTMNLAVEALGKSISYNPCKAGLWYVNHACKGRPCWGYV